MTVTHGGCSRALRREIIYRNQILVKNNGIVAGESYGRDAVVVYPAGEEVHGNFFPASYAAILGEPSWRCRLQKAHTGRKNLPKDSEWNELDSCTSSDALLMNIFCNPRAMAEGKLHRLMGVDLAARPEFGVRAAAPLAGGHRDRTEADMRLGDVLVEAKLTEADFQTCRPAIMERYADFPEVFDRLGLPRLADGGYVSYQLLRSVLAAHTSDSRFCVISDARRPDLREQWFMVMQCVRDSELRLRCQMLTWQEIAAILPAPLQRWLEAKYGVYAPGTEPQLDASEWYW